MNDPISELFKTAGAVAGIGGIAMAVVLLLFRDFIKNGLVNITPGQRFWLLLSFLLLSFLIGIAGLGAWTYTSLTEYKKDYTLLEKENATLLGQMKKRPNLTISTSAEIPTGQAMSGKATATLTMPDGTVYTSGEQSEGAYIEHRDENIGDGARWRDLKSAEFQLSALQKAVSALNASK